MQAVIHLVADRTEQLLLPCAEMDVMPDLRWGGHDALGSPAYWAAQSWLWELEAPDHYRLGSSLREELLACMLGGYGIPAEVGLAAYERLRSSLAEAPSSLCNEAFVRAELSRLLTVNGRNVRYRFPNQKARCVSTAFQALDDGAQELSDRALRDHLTTLSGVGPKTASWVVRNLRGSDEVAILDIHLLRVGRMLGIFEQTLTVERHYPHLEAAFLSFASAIGARPSILDSVMWMTMRAIPRSVLVGMTAGGRSVQPMGADTLDFAL